MGNVAEDILLQEVSQGSPPSHTELAGRLQSTCFKLFSLRLRLPLQRDGPHRSSRECRLKMMT